MVVLEDQILMLCPGLGLHSQVLGSVLGIEPQVLGPGLGLKGQVIGFAGLECLVGGP